MEIFNRTEFLERIEGDEDLCQELLQTFLEYTPQQLQVIRQALEAGDALRLQGQAHSLKGAAASISAEAMKETARRLELAGKNCDLEQAGPLVEALLREFARLQEALNK